MRNDRLVLLGGLFLVLVETGRLTEARRHFAEAVRIAPDMEAAREMIERLRDAP